jgi:diguanylate cyclase (GGDEF)-like protein
MMAFGGEVTDEESARLDALNSYQILDTPGERQFDRIAQLAKDIFDVSSVLISFVAKDRQWFKSRLGIEECEMPREHAICHYTIQQSEPLVISDTLLDARTAQNPITRGDQPIRFYAGAPLISPEGQALGSFCVINNAPRTFSVRETTILKGLAELVMEQLELHRRSVCDWLTGASSKGAFHSLLQDVLAFTTTRRANAAVIALDLDHFKSVNDRFGHLAGDEVLVRMTAACRAELDNTQVLARMGGEEFCVLATDTTADAAHALAERVRAAIEDLPLDGVATGLSATASFGVSMFGRTDASIADVLERADRALYRAKSQGRNRVCAEPADALAASTHTVA